MIGDILHCRPEFPFPRADNAAAGECKQESGDVRVGCDLVRCDDLVSVGHTHHSLVKCPVAELAERHAVTDVIVFASAPRNDVGGIHHGVLFRRDDPHPAKGAAVIVGFDHDSTKALIAGRRSVVVRFDNLLYQRQVGFLFQNPAVRYGVKYFISRATKIFFQAIEKGKCRI